MEDWTCGEWLAGPMVAIALVLGTSVAGAAEQGTQGKQGAQGTKQQTSQQEMSQQRMSQHQRDRMGRSDRALEDRVFVRLIESPMLGPDLTVKADGGVVTLSGTVGSEQAKQRALRTARRTPGVDEVKDQLRVDTSRAQRAGTGAAVNDTELAKRVAQQVAREITGANAGEDWWGTGWRVEGAENRWNFIVEADGGAITLEGDVPRHEIIRKAAEAARKVQGVTSVRTELDIERRYGAYGPYYGYPYGAYGYEEWRHPYYGYDPYSPAASPRMESGRDTGEERGKDTKTR